MTPEREQILKDIEQSVCHDFGITPMRLKSNQRGDVLKDARTLFSLKARAAEFAFTEIGRFLNKDRTSIMYLVKKVGGR